jgi:hypothetical protein
MEKTINTVKENVTDLSTGDIITQTSELELLFNAILLVPQGGHASNDIIELASVYGRLKTSRDKLAHGAMVKFDFDDTEWKIICKQVAEMRWTVMSPVIIEFVKKYKI